MKRIFDITLFVAAALFAVGCQNDLTEGNVASPETAVNSVEALIDEDLDAGVRNSLVDEEGHRHIVWSKGDLIGLYGVLTGSNVKGSLTPGCVGQSNGVFVYSGDVDQVEVAYYPYSRTASRDGNTLTLTLPHIQKYTAESVFDSNVTIMVGKPVENTLVFRNTCSILEVQLTGSDLISSVALQSKSKPLSGTGTIDTSAETPSFVIPADASNAANEVVLDLGEGLQLSSTPTSLYFVVPTGEYTDLSVVAYTKNSVAKRVATVAHTFVARHIVPMNPFSLEKPDYSGAANLSAAGAANCYVVAPAEAAQKCSFALNHVDGSAVAGDALLADCLWETSAGLVGNVSLDKAAGRVYFEVAGGNVAGNALISVLDKERKVLWSWHIWVANPVDQSWGATPLTFLDRNLGATWSPATKADADAMTTEQAVASCGLQYQWGRNVPMPGPNNMTIDGTHEVTSTGSNLNKDGNAVPNGLFNNFTPVFVFNKYYPDYQGWELRNIAGTMKDLAAYPLSFNKILSMSSASNCVSWATDCVATGENAGWKAAKTNTDPCPAGYRVPSLSEISYFANDGTSEDVIALTHVAIEGDATKSYGGYFEANGNLVWAPKAGFRTSGYNTLNANGYTASMNRTGGAGGYCSFWTFNPADTHDDLKAISGYHNISSSRASGDVYQRFFYLNNLGNFKPEASNARVHALSCGSSVRCVKIK